MSDEDGDNPSLELLRASLPPPPREAPVEISTLFDEIRRSVIRGSWILAAVVLGIGAWYLPAAVRYAQLSMPDRGVEVMAKVGRSRSTIAFDFRAMQEVDLEFLDERGDVQQAVVRCPLSRSMELRERRRVPLLYDRLDATSVHVLAWTPASTTFSQLWLGALVFPALGHLLGWRLAQRRRRAYAFGSPAVAKVRGYHRFLGIHYLELDHRAGGEELRLLEPISPAEVDLHVPLSTLAVLVYRRPRGGLVSCTLGRLGSDDE